MVEWKARAFRTAKFANYGSHFLFILYDCGADSDPGVDKERAAVKVVVNGEAILWPGCRDIYCPYVTWRATLREKLSDSFLKLCKRLDGKYHPSSSCKCNIRQLFDEGELSWEDVSGSKHNDEVITASLVVGGLSLFSGVVLGLLVGLVVVYGLVRMRVLSVRNRTQPYKRTVQASPSEGESGLELTEMMDDECADGDMMDGDGI